jgi:anti-sigma regulatory factor (Ser/Thr protein kinase)
MWEKIVLNLLSNAFKFTFEGEIIVALRGRGDRAELRISDTGTGIAADQLPRIFERFHRVHGSRSRAHEGTGIGLALVHELVKLHGGQVSVESSPGTGTTFTVSVPFGSAHLPKDRVAAPRTATSTALAAHAFAAEAQRWTRNSNSALSADLPAPGASPAENAPFPNARVLIADDNADGAPARHRRPARRAVRQWGSGAPRASDRKPAHQRRPLHARARQHSTVRRARRRGRRRPHPG